jgi:hypothetical protein
MFLPKVLKAYLILLIALSFNMKSFAQGKEGLIIPSIPHPLYREIKPANFTIKANDLFISAGEKTDMFRDPTFDIQCGQCTKTYVQA